MKIFFIVIFWGIALKSNSQTLTNSCINFESLFNDSQIKSSFHLSNKNDTLSLIDKKQWFKGHCHSFTWDRNYVKIINDTSVINKISKQNPYAIFKGDCKTFIFDGFTKKGKLHYFNILQPCSGLLTEAEVKFNKKDFKIMSIKKGVL
jgi:hypothetical protein